MEKDGEGKLGADGYIKRQSIWQIMRAETADGEEVVILGNIIKENWYKLAVG